LVVSAAQTLRTVTSPFDASTKLRRLASQIASKTLSALSVSRSSRVEVVTPTRIDAHDLKGSVGRQDFPQIDDVRRDVEAVLLSVNQTRGALQRSKELLQAYLSGQQREDPRFLLAHCRRHRHRTLEYATQGPFAAEEASL